MLCATTHRAQVSADATERRKAQRVAVLDDDRRIRSEVKVTASRRVNARLSRIVRAQSKRDVRIDHKQTQAHLTDDGDEDAVDAVRDEERAVDDAADDATALERRDAHGAQVRVELDDAVTEPFERALVATWSSGRRASRRQRLVLTTRLRRFVTDFSFCLAQRDAIEIGDASGARRR